MGRPIDGDKDRALIGLLTANGRMPVAEIAAKLGVSRATAQARLARLERDGIIKGYTVVLGDGAETPTDLTAIVLVELDVRKQPAVIAELRTSPEIVSCHSMSGQFDLMINVRAANARRLDDTLDWIAAIDGVRRTMSSILLARKFER